MGLENLSQIFESKCGFSTKDKILVGVSGGPDSLVLLDVLYQSGFTIYVAHFDHQLRKESEEEGNFVQSLANDLGLIFIHESGDTRAYANQQKCSIEEAARELRYQFLFHQAHEVGASSVAVGHTADDQVETVLMHMIRGTGLDGLAGMTYRTFTQWSTTIPLVRPLLGVWRDEVLKYCSAKQLNPIFDQSNFDNTFFRNRLRNDLVPMLEDLNPNFKLLIWRTAETITEDRRVLDAEVEVVLNSTVIESDDHSIAVDLTRFSALPLGYQRRILRKVLSVLRPGLRDIGFEAIANGLRLISDPPRSRQADLIAGLKLLIESDQFIVTDWKTDPIAGDWPHISSGTQIELMVPGKINLNDDWELHADILPIDDPEFKSLYSNTDPFIAYIDVAAGGTHLMIRRRQPGDRFAPLGMDGHTIKISDFLINEKLPKRARNGWPLIFSKGQLIWVPGFRISDFVKVNDSTTKVAKIVLKKGS